jgi:hypothetical protein
MRLTHNLRVKIFLKFKFGAGDGSHALGMKPKLKSEGPTNSLASRAGVKQYYAVLSELC